jgi:hypothetical protein
MIGNNKLTGSLITLQTRLEETEDALEKLVYSEVIGCRAIYV